MNEDVQRAAAALESNDELEVETARRFFLKMTQQEPDDAYYVLALGMAFDRQGDPAQAEACFERAIQLAPSDNAAYVSRGNMRLKRGDVSGARADFMKALTLMPEESEGRLLVQATLASMGPGGGEPQ